MYCRKCGCEIPNDGKFCPKCGCSTENYKLDIVETSTNRRSISRKKTAIVVAAVVCLLISCAVGAIIHSHNQAKYDEMVSYAALYIESGEVEDAIGCLEKAVKLKPREVQNYIDIADIYGELKEFESAVTILEQGYKKTKNEELAEEMEYYTAIINANTASASSLWDETITHLNTAIEIKPDVVDNYLDLATAYVEIWDLFHASEILKQGYDATQDAELRHVSIWGPLSPVEIALYLTDSMPVTRCEYVFSENSINSYVYFGGSPNIGAGYICEDGKVKYISILDYRNSELYGVFPQQIPNYPASRVLLYFDLAYDLDGRVSAVTYDGEVLVSLEYTDGYCTAIIAKTDYEGMFSVGDSMTFIYDEQNRISQINYAGDTISYTYNFDGSSSAILPRYETWFQFNDKGMMIGVSEPGGNDNFTVSTENGQIDSIESDGFYCEFSYSEGKLSAATERYTDQTVYNIVKYYYENVDGIEYLTKIVSVDESSKTTELIISYDENGNIVSVDHGNGTIYSFAYSEEDQMTSFSIMSDGVFAIYEIKYDYFGRAIGWNKVC